MTRDGEATMTSGPRTLAPVDDPEDTIKHKLAELFEVPEEDVTLDELFEPTPHLYVFQARWPGEPRRRPEYAFGALAGDRIEFARAVHLVADVWGYDHRRPVSAETVARVFGLLASDFEPQWPLIAQADIDSVHKRYRDELFVPRETVVDGLPAVQYWKRHPRTPYPVLITAIFRPDRTVSFRSKTPDSVDS